MIDPLLIIIAGLWLFVNELGKSVMIPSDGVGTVLENIQRIVTVLAIIIGGIWAYFNFVRSRTYRPRLEIYVTGLVRQHEERQFLHLSFSVKNVGLTNFDISQTGTGMQLESYGERAYIPEVHAAPWERVTTLPILMNHSIIEPAETVKEEKLIIISEEEVIAYKVTLRLMSVDNTEWQISSIIFAQEDAHKLTTEIIPNLGERMS